MSQLFILIVVGISFSSCQSSAPSIQATQEKKTEAPKGADVHLVSPYPSSVANFPLANFHLVAKNKGSVYRGMRPMNAEHAKILVDQANISDVLIFRETTADVPKEEEMGWFKNLGLSDENISYVPFRWRGFENDFKRPCLETLEALEKIKLALATSSKSLFVHCTVGEDRTGYLMGLYRMAFEKWNFSKAHREEMCARGYADANVQKPEFVNTAVHDNISVLFLKMEYGLKTKKWSAARLNRAFCEKDPSAYDSIFLASIADGKKRLHCR